MVQQVLQRFDFTYSSPQATPLSTRDSLSALPSDESVEPSGPYPELVGCFIPEHMAAAKRVLRYLCSTSGMGLVLGGRRLVVLTGHADASWADDQATQRSSQGYSFSLGFGSVSWRSTRSSSVLSSSCEAEIYAGAMASQELRWLTYLLTDLGEPPRSPPVLYVDNKAMLALCREHRLEHRTKHIALRYFLARELQQRGQLRLAYVASEANTADIFTKALPPGDHQRFCTMLGPQHGGPCGGLRQQQQRRSETQSPQQLREWLFQRGTSGGSDSCPYVIRTGVRAGQTCGKLHTQHCCFSRLDDDWHALFGEDVELPRRADLLRSRIAIFDLDFDAILSAMYALSVSAEGDCYLCVPPDPGIAATALGASESGTLPSTAPAQALHTFTLDSGASRCFFRDSTTLTPLPAPIPVRLADPSGGPIVARSSTVLPCPAVVSGSLSGLHLPSFSTNLVSIAALQDAMVTTTTPEGQRVSICTCTQTGRHLAMFTRRPGSSLYTLATEPPQVAASAQVSALDQVAASCSCRLLSHQTLLWHHRLGHPSLPRLRGMYSCLLVSCLPRSLPPLLPSPAPPCLPKGEVVDVLIPWIRTARLYLRERFGQDLPVMRLHSDRGGEFSSDLLRDFCHGEGILQSFKLPDSRQQNGIAEFRIGVVMDVAPTSMIHAAAPHFLWSFAVPYAAHLLNLWPHVSLPETSATLRWTGEVGDASVFRVQGSRAFVCDTSADKLSAHAIPCVFLGVVPDAPGWQFYHPTSHRVVPSHDVTFDESVHFYRLFPYRSAPPPPSPLFLAPGPPPVDPLLPQGPAPSGVSLVDPLPGTMPIEVAVGLRAAPSVASGGAEPGVAGSESAGSGGAESGGEEPGGADPEGVEPGGAESEGAESGGAEPRGAASSGCPTGASPRLSPQQLREWLVRRARLRSGAPGAGDARPGGAGVSAGADGTGGTAAASPGGACTRGVGAAGTGGVGGAGAGDPTEPGAAGAEGSCAGGAGAGGAGARGARVGGTGTGGAGAAGAGAVDPGAGGAGGTPSSPLPAPSPHIEQSGGLTERREPASRPVLPVRTARRAPRSRPPPLPGTHTIALRPSSVPLRVPLPAPPESSLSEVPDLESDRPPAASPTVSCLIATVVTDPSFESTVASALVFELLDFAAACRLDDATALVAETAFASPPSVGVECALGTDVLEDMQEDIECFAAAVPRFASMLLAPEGDPDAPVIPTPRSYADAITGFTQRHGVDYFQTFSPTPKMTTLRVLLHVAAQRDYELHSLDFSTDFLQGSLHEEIWLRRPTGFTGSFPAGTQTTIAALGFACSTADLSLFLHTDNSLPPFYVLVYVDDLVFATADREALTLVKLELQKRHTCTDLGELRSYLGLQITRDKARRTITLTQSHMVHQVLQLFGFLFFLPHHTPLSTSHSLSAPPSDESVEPSVPYPELVGCLITSGMGLVLGGRGPVVLTGHADASWVDDSATQRSSQGYTFSLDIGVSSYFFRDCTDLTPLHTPVTVALADPSVGSVVARSTTTLPCPTAPSGFLTGYYTPSFSRNLVGVSHLHDLGFVTTFPLGEPVPSCTVGATGAPLATFHREPGSGLYSLDTRPGLPESLAPLPHSPAPPCTPCVKGRQHAAPHSSSFPPTTAPLQTLHLDVWGPSSVLGPPADYRVKGSLTHVRATGVNKLSERTRACGFLGFPLNTSSWMFYDPVTHQFFPSQDVTFDESVRYYRSRPHRGSEAFPPPLFLTPEPPLVAPVAPSPSRPAPSGVSHVTPQSSPLKRPVPVVSWDAGGATAEGGGTRAAGPGGAGSGGAGDVRVETFPVEDTAISTRRSSPASPPSFPSVPQFPPRSSLRPVATKPGGVPAGGTEDTGGVVAGGSCSGGPFHLVLRSRVPPPSILPKPPELSLTVFHDPLSDYLRASRPVLSCVLSALVTHPSAPPLSVSALVTTVAGFASSHRLDYATHLVSCSARSLSSGGAPVFPLEVLKDRQFELGFLAAAVPHLCTMLLALEGDHGALDIPIPRTHAEAVSRPWASYWIAAEEVEMASYRSTGTYVNAVPPPGANVVSGMWLYKVKRPPGSPPVFKACYVARGFSQREGVDFFQTFAPTPKMTTLRVLLHIAAQRDYELHSLDFSTAFLQGSLHEQIWLRRPPGFTCSFPPGIQWQLR
ncbi:unnamed protein product [Closterium sp. NIES-54]